MSNEPRPIAKRSPCIAALALSRLFLAPFQSASATPQLPPVDAVQGPTSSINFFGWFFSWFPSFFPNESATERAQKCQQARNAYNALCPADVVNFNFDDVVRDRYSGTIAVSLAGFGSGLQQFRRCVHDDVFNYDSCSLDFAGSLAPVCQLAGASSGTCATEVLQRAQLD